MGRIRVTISKAFSKRGCGGSLMIGTLWTLYLDDGNKVRFLGDPPMPSNYAVLVNWKRTWVEVVE